MAENSAKRARKPKVKAPSASKVTKKQPRTSNKGSKASAQALPSQELEETGPIASSSRTRFDDSITSNSLQNSLFSGSDTYGRVDVGGAFDTGFGGATPGDDALNGPFGNNFGTPDSLERFALRFGSPPDTPSRISNLSLLSFDHTSASFDPSRSQYYPTSSAPDLELYFGLTTDFEGYPALSSGGGDASLAHGPGSYDAPSNNVPGYTSYDDTYGADFGTHGSWAGASSQGSASPWATDPSVVRGNSVETNATTPSSSLWPAYDGEGWASTTNTTPDATPLPTNEPITVPTSEETTLAKEAEPLAQATSVVSEPTLAPKKPTEPAEEEKKDTKGKARATEVEEPAGGDAVKTAEAPATKPKVDKGKGRARDVDPAPSNEPSSAPKKGTKGKGKAKGKGKQKGKTGAADVEATTAGEASTSSQTAAAASSSATVVPANTAPTRARAGGKKRRATGDDEDEAAAQPAKRNRKIGWDRKKTEWDSLALTVNPTPLPDSAPGPSTAGRLVPASEASSSTSAGPAPQAVRSGDYFYTFAPSPDLTVTATAASTSLNALGTSSGQTATTAASSSTATTGQVSSGRSQRSGGNGGSRAQDYTTYTFQLDRQDGNTVAGSSGSAAPSIQGFAQPYHPPGN